MTNPADHSWTHAGHGLPDSEPSLNTTAIATGLQLPAGFAAIAGDAAAGTFRYRARYSAMAPRRIRRTAIVRRKEWQQIVRRTPRRVAAFRT